MKRIAFLLPVLACCFLFTFASESSGKGKEKIRWVSISTKQFSLDQELGALSSCAYRLVESGKSAEFVHENQMRVVAVKGDDTEVSITVYVNKKEVKKLGKKLVQEALESAVQDCYERISGTDETD